MVKLSTGKEIDANRKTIGINEKGEVTTGYDELLAEFDQTVNDDDNWMFESQDNGGMGYVRATPIERMELADIMMGRWARYKQAAIDDHAATYEENQDAASNSLETPGS